MPSEIAGLGSEALAVRADAADPRTVGAKMDRIRSEFGRIDILVNDAAFSKAIPLILMDSGRV